MNQLSEEDFAMLVKIANMKLPDIRTLAYSLVEGKPKDHERGYLVALLFDKYLKDKVPSLSGDVEYKRIEKLRELSETTPDLSSEYGTGTPKTLTAGKTLDGYVDILESTFLTHPSILFNLEYFRTATSACTMFRRLARRLLGEG